MVYPDSIKIVNYDPKLKQMQVVDIDGKIIFDTSSNKGRYPLKNIYNLSINEKTQSDLFRKTVMKNLHLPIQSVLNCRHRRTDDHLGISSFILCRSEQNISDLIYISFLRWNVGKNVSYKNLSDYGVLLTDSENGEKYIDKSKIFEKLEFDFSMDLDIKDVVNVDISIPGESITPAYFDDLIKISGGRVVNTERMEGSDEIIGCEIRGDNKVFMKYLQGIFACTTIKEEGNGNFLHLRFSKNTLETY
jgi:hypothetical protein